MSKGSGKKRERKRKNRRRNKLEYPGLINRVKANKSLPDDVVMVMGSEVKMSQVIIDFAKPVLETANTEEEFRKGIGLAALAWNTSLLPEVERDEMISQSISSSIPDAADSVLVALEMLIARKHQYFPNNNRYIMDYELSGTPPDLHLSVVSSL